MYTLDIGEVLQRVGGIHMARVGFEGTRVGFLDSPRPLCEVP